MSDFVIDENSDGFKLGIEIGAIKKRILELPLEELMDQANHWETMVPLTNPTLFMQYGKLMEDFTKNVVILLTAKKGFLRDQVDIS